MKKYRTLAAVLAGGILLAALAAGCRKQQGQSVTDETAQDTITMLLPPVSSGYQNKLSDWARDFNARYPNLTLQIETAGWEDYKEKLNVLVNAGTPPDIAFVETDSLSTLADSGLLVDISGIISQAEQSDFDESALRFFTLGNSLYGLPIYISVQSLGGNIAMMEEAGIDWRTVQQQGWTFEEFRRAIQAGTTPDHYGFIFAVAGVTAGDYLNIMVRNAGMPAPFTTDLKYAYTGRNFLELLKAIRLLIDDGSMPREMSSIDAGRRWNMFLTGKTMIFGKGLSTFEGLARANNEKIRAADGSAVQDSIELEYAVLPVPTFFGYPQAAQGIVGGYSMFRTRAAPNPIHQANVMKAMYYMASGEVAAWACSELYVSGLSQTVRDALAQMQRDGDRNRDNIEAIQILTGQVAEARPDIPTDLSVKAARLMDEVIIPNFQALLANETTADEMYRVVREAAIEAFGVEGVVQD